VAVFGGSGGIFLAESFGISGFSYFLIGLSSLNFVAAFFFLSSYICFNSFSLYALFFLISSTLTLAKPT